MLIEVLKIVLTVLGIGLAVFPLASSLVTNGIKVYFREKKKMYGELSKAIAEGLKEAKNNEKKA